MSKSSKALAKSWPYPRYKDFQRELRKVATAWFKVRGLPVQKRYSFILANRDLWPFNIIMPEVADYIESQMQSRKAEGKRFPLHDYIHHGLSSQAMLFNLIGPFVERGHLSPVREAFEASGIPWPEGDIEATFEVEDRDVFNEDSGQPTSIDLVIQGGKGALFVEAKFTEAEFGGCSVFERGDCDGETPVGDLTRCYLHHIGRKYWDRMAEQGLLTDRLGDCPICPFTCYYQFFREVMYAIHQGGHFVLLHDARNPTFVCEGSEGQRGLFPFLTSLVPEPLQEKIFQVSIQQVFAVVKDSCGGEEWVSDFAEKYGM